MAQDDDAKRRAVSAVEAVRDDIHRVITFGTTGYDIFGQPQFHPDEVPEIGWVEQWREGQQRNAVVEEGRAPERDLPLPGE